MFKREIYRIRYLLINNFDTILKYKFEYNSYQKYFKRKIYLSIIKCNF